MTSLRHCVPQCNPHDLASEDGNLSVYVDHPQLAFPPNLQVRMSGGGRCNVMHDPFNPDKTVKRITRYQPPPQNEAQKELCHV